MKTIFAAIAVSAAMFAAPAFAGTIDNTYGNTIIVTYATGAVAQYHFNADGTFTGVAPGGSHMAGRYTAEGDQLCLIPPSGQAPQCTQIQTDKNVGDTWTQLGSDGSQITVELRAGREEHAH